MDADELQRVRGELETFAAEMFAGLARSDQRATGLTYLRGLMLDGQRKSMQPMAARLGTDHQRLQQFLTSSTWDYAAVRRRLAERALQVVGPDGPDVWIVDDTGFPKDGKASPGVARQYSGTLGKVANCQIAVSLHAATDKASAVLDWRLFLPPSWDETTVPDAEGRAVNPHLASQSQRWGDDTTLGVAGEPKVKLRKPPPTPAQIVARRAASKIPDQVRYAPKWQLALDMIDELASWGHTPSDHGDHGVVPQVLVADAGYGQVGAFRAGLSKRGIRYVVAVVSTTTVHPAAAVSEPVPYAGVGKHPRPRYRQDPVSVKTLATTPDPAADPARRQVRWREAARSVPGKRVWMSGWFTATRVRPAGRGVKRNDDGTYPQAWLLTQWPSQDATEPSDYWLCDLPAETTLDDLVALAKARWRIEHDYRELKTALGLDHFEGRSWNGWHRHVTLVTAAHLFLTTQRLQRPDTGKALGQNRT